MQLKTVKTAADLPFRGIELVKIDSSISEVIIGGKLHIKAGSYGGMQVLVQAPGEVAKRYKVAATLEGFPQAVEYFEYSHEADSRVSHFQDLNAKVEKVFVDVLIGEAGDITEGAPPAPAELDEIPF